MVKLCALIGTRRLFVEAFLEREYTDEKSKIDNEIIRCIRIFQLVQISLADTDNSLKVFFEEKVLTYHLFLLRFLKIFKVLEL